MEERDTGEYHDKVRAIVGADMPEIDKLKAGFGMVTSDIISYARQEVDLARAMQDREAVIKVQIKMETLKSARQIFDRWYTMITGRRAWDE